MWSVTMQLRRLQAQDTRTPRREKVRLRLFKIAHVIVRLNHIASSIVNTNHNIT